MTPTVAFPDVFVLGAGFSAAISDRMPLLRDLTSHVFDVALGADRPLLGDDTAEVFGTNIEEFMTYFGTDSPWLDEAINLHQRSVFLKMTGVLSDILLQEQNGALEAEAPPWLPALLQRWHDDRSWVITMNYDTLVEKALGDLVRVDGQPLRVSESHAVPATPIGLRQAGTWNGDRHETLRLAKLHGSLSWCYSGAADASGETIYDFGFKPGWGTDSQDEPGDVRSRAVDKVPLIVPPTTAKTAFFNNETVRSQWQVARDALVSVGRHYYLGFSFPLTDMPLRFLVAPMSAGREAVVVNSAPVERLRDNYKAAYPMGSVDDTTYTGSEDAIARFVRDLTR